MNCSGYDIVSRVHILLALSDVKISLIRGKTLNVSSPLNKMIYFIIYVPNNYSNNTPGPENVINDKKTVGICKPKYYITINKKNYSIGTTKPNIFNGLQNL